MKYKTLKNINNCVMIWFTTWFIMEEFFYNHGDYRAFVFLSLTLMLSYLDIPSAIENSKLPSWLEEELIEE